MSAVHRLGLGALGLALALLSAPPAGAAPRRAAAGRADHGPRTGKTETAQSVGPPNAGRLSGAARREDRPAAAPCVCVSTPRRARPPRAGQKRRASRALPPPAPRGMPSPNTAAVPDVPSPGRTACPASTRGTCVEESAARG